MATVITTIYRNLPCFVQATVKQEPQEQPDGTADPADVAAWLAELNAMGAWNADADADGGGGARREQKVKKNGTDLACPECEVGAAIICELIVGPQRAARVVLVI